MITTKELKTEEDFKNLKRGDTVACEFHNNVHDYPKTYRFNTFKIHDNKLSSSEIILQKKNNIYFNWKMFIGEGNGSSNLKSIILIKHEE